MAQEVMSVPNEVAAELAGIGDGVLESLRDRLGLQAGSSLEVVESAEGVILKPVESEPSMVKEGDTWVLRLYDKKNVLQELIPFADKNLEERKGGYMLYQNGNLKAEGNYDKGYKVGEWKYYYPNRQLSEKINYAWDKLHGANLTYWDNGQLKASKNYMHGVKTGQWKFFDKDGKLASTEVYSPL